jgi:hydrogenase expression/formation protein HypE
MILPIARPLLREGRGHRNTRMPIYRLGKPSHGQLAKLLARLPGKRSPDVLIGPAIGEDAAVVAIGCHALVAATDPVTFAAERAGWYAVHVNANDVATMGAAPRWFQACVLMPPRSHVTVESVFDDMAAACREVGATVLGGHTEVTAGLVYPIVIGTMLGLVEKKSVLRTAGSKVGDAIVLTKSAAIEATSIIARHAGRRLARSIGRRLVDRAAKFLFDPGISVVREAMLAARAGATAMHDPTEGGVLTGLWEMACAGRKRFVVDTIAIPVRPETHLLCRRCDIDPLRAIASGSLLITIAAERAGALMRRLSRGGIRSAVIGQVQRGPAGLFDGSGRPIPVSATDEITKLFQ